MRRRDLPAVPGTRTVVALNGCHAPLGREPIPDGCVAVAPLGMNVMNPTLHHKIEDKLEAAKASGLICDYLVSWVGFGGRLDPVVSGWKNSAQPDESVQRLMVTLLTGLVSEQNVRVRTE
jgi:hypothetical protein